jgi:hypothetical protein
MPPSTPKAPAEPEWDFLWQKKPSLSTEHIESIAKLSDIYLQPEAAEFSEYGLFSSLRALYELSLQQSTKMSKKHAKQIQKMVINAFSKEMNQPQKFKIGQKLSKFKIGETKKPKFKIGKTQDRLYEEGKEPSKNCNWNEKSERALVDASAKLLSSIYHKGMPFEQAKKIVEANRNLGKPMLYAGARDSIEDFLASGAVVGVFADPYYGFAGFAEDRRHYFDARAKKMTGSISFEEKGSIKEGGKWVYRFEFMGEEKTIVCYSAKSEDLFAKFSPPELAGGIAHYATVHRSPEGTLLTAQILSRVAPGGHVEAYGLEDQYLAKKVLGLDIVFRSKLKGGQYEIGKEYNILEKTSDTKISPNTIYLCEEHLESMIRILYGNFYRYKDAVSDPRQSSVDGILPIFSRMKEGLLYIPEADRKEVFTHLRKKYYDVGGGLDSFKAHKAQLDGSEDSNAKGFVRLFNETESRKQVIFEANKQIVRQAFREIFMEYL